MSTSRESIKSHAVSFLYRNQPHPRQGKKLIVARPFSTEPFSTSPSLRPRNLKVIINVGLRIWEIQFRVSKWGGGTSIKINLTCTVTPFASETYFENRTETIGGIRNQSSRCRCKHSPPQTYTVKYSTAFYIHLKCEPKTILPIVANSKKNNSRQNG